ncbi:inactive ubiquitin thioesterase OTULINL [Heteronotia binoei]|uniref:inactive ubiquitin thioesterase OTULINL n=1 Tax=Heteronotia binoei TaxID=13085 RepID=UPI00292D52E9|nr:inactive ubiquitin thioesterase OTULINL [Heteronotia binoei]XP_060098999.1 inactive ubiquitin thioesterase OTULINL [Heteronotia binoei]
MPLLTAALWYCRQLYTYLAHLLKWWSRYLQRKFIRNHSVLAEVDLLGYCAQKWKGETEQDRKMREAYEDLFWRHHIKYIREVRRDNYCVLRAVLFQIFSQGIPLPPWMKAVDVLKLPEKLLYSQGCNWIQQYSFGPEQYSSSNTLGKLRKCIDTLKNQWMEISSIKDPHERGKLCCALFGDETVEQRMYEAVKFIMLYQVIETYECLNNEERVPSFFHLLFMRDTSLDPLSYMINHLNSVGDKRGLDQVDLFLLGYSLAVKIIVYRLSKFKSKDFHVSYTEACQRDWHEVSLLTEDDWHYHIPVAQM